MSDFAIQWFQTFPDPKVFQSKTPSAMSQCHGRFINSDSRFPFFSDSEILRVYNIVQRIKTLKATDPTIRDFTSPVIFNGEGDGTPLQYSCLENPMDGGAW